MIECVEGKDIFTHIPFFPDSKALSTLHGFITPSTSLAADASPSDYFERLRHAYERLYNAEQEYVPPSRDSSPVCHERQTLLRARVIEQWVAAREEPSNGKWEHLRWTLRLGCTRGRRWLVPRYNITQEDGSTETKDWVLPETEEEWFEAERRWDEETGNRRKRMRLDNKTEEKGVGRGVSTEKLREKVAGWRAGVEMDKLASRPQLVKKRGLGDRESTKSLPAPKIQHNAREEGPYSSSLGFPVIKRPNGLSSHSALTQKPRLAPNTSVEAACHLTSITEVDSVMIVTEVHPEQKSSPHHGHSRGELTTVYNAPTALEGHRRLADGQDGRTGKNSPNTPDRIVGIADISEMDFLPPSFPEKMKTSTPVPNKTIPDLPQKPPPIEPVPSPLSSSSAPRLTSSLPNITAGPLPSPPDVSPSLPVHSSDRRSANGHEEGPHGHLEDALPFSLAPAETVMSAVSSEPRATTPPRSSTPSRTPEITPHKILGNAQGLPLSSTPSRALPTLTALLASSRRSKQRPTRPPNKHAMTGSYSQRATTPRTPTKSGPSPARSYFSEAGSGSSHGSVFQKPLRSPISPIFSQNRSAFKPSYISTQRREPPYDDMLGGGDLQSIRTGSVPVDSGPFNISYNSQFDIEGNIHRLNERLEQDTEGWMRDPAYAEDISCWKSAI